MIESSGWLCAERAGDFHDEHAYLHNLQFVHYADRVRAKLGKPLLLGETMCFDGPAGERSSALECRRFQIESLARDLPDAVVTGLRDVPGAPLGLFTAAGAPKEDAAAWSWHTARPGPPGALPPLDPSAAFPGRDAVIGPRKGAWKCREHTFWSPVVRVLAGDLPEDVVELIHREAFFELFGGRVLTHAGGARVLVELVDHHDRPADPARHPLVIELLSAGERRVDSAFRTDTPAGRALAAALAARTGPAPELGPLLGDSIVLERWTMHLPGEPPREVRADTVLVNAGANVFEGEAAFTCRFEHPGGRTVLVAESPNRSETSSSCVSTAAPSPWPARAPARGTGRATGRGSTDSSSRRARTISPSPCAAGAAAGGWSGPCTSTADPDLRVF